MLALLALMAVQAPDSTESRLLALPDTASLRAMVRQLTRTAHVAGTPAQAAAQDYVLERTRAWGLQTSSKSYTVYIPHLDTQGVWVMRPGAAPEPLSLEEPVLPDHATAGNATPAFNAYGGDGDVTADVVYVGYGLTEDYQRLDSLRIAVRGHIALARYGRSFRGIKAREAERHGALGLLLYSDPEDDGYYRGDVYPTGPMRPPAGVQRGSVLNDIGDPTTPGRPSVPGAPRLPEDSLPVPHIPVVPLGYGNARQLLDALAGPSVPQDWQGALPFRYHVGPGPVRARVLARRERGARAMHDITNTFAVLPGARWPNEWVIVGGHLDAWTPGAEDNISGSAVVLETARVYAELAGRGVRPARTVIFANWDAEEWGLIGSTEWVEEESDSLLAHAVAYINEDAVVSGPRFGGAASPSLKRLFADVARRVPDPAGRGTVYETWLAQHHDDTVAAHFGNLGGGSDFQGFYHHLGIPAGEMSFEGPSGNYHSMYDSYDWMARFGDPDFTRHRAVTQLVALAVWRLANDDVLPLDYVGWGREMRGLVSQLDSAIARRGWSLSTAPLAKALHAFTAAAAAVPRAASARRAGAALPKANAALMQVERRLTRPEGPAGRSWYKSLQFASDVDRGYQTLAFPSVAEAIRYADPATAARELADLVTRLGDAQRALEAAAEALR